VRQVVVHLNGIALTQDMHFTHGANMVTLIPPYIPMPGADIMIEGWI